VEEVKLGRHTIVERKPPCAKKLMLVVGAMNNVMYKVNNLHGGVHRNLDAV
jgi:hypothetical protein